MSARYVGKTSLQLGRLGLGVAPLGNLYSNVTDQDAADTLAATSRGGIGWFDAAPFYGYGLAEKRLGAHLCRSSDPKPVVSTKVGRCLRPRTDQSRCAYFAGELEHEAFFDYSADGIVRSYDDSLERLKIERTQILLLHDVDRVHHAPSHRPLVKQLLDVALPTLNRLKEQGRIDAIGIGVCDWEVGFELLASADFDCVLLAGRYTLLDQSAFSSGFLDACTRRQVSVLAAGVFNSGFLWLVETTISTSLPPTSCSRDGRSYSRYAADTMSTLPARRLHWPCHTPT
jgi:D-threo-aldose 1-dehydrogenase